MQTIIIHYGEIAIKKGRRNYFENLLVDNIRKKIAAYKPGKIQKDYGRIIINLNEHTNNEGILKQLATIPGINNYALTETCPNDLAIIKEKVLALAAKEHQNPFAIRTKNSNKQFSHKSTEVNELLGEALLEAYPTATVDLTNPKIAYTIEITQQQTYIYTKKYESVAGLPTGSSGTMICLLSGGIDSPVAAAQLMKRGTTVILAHVYNKTVNNEATLQKIKDLAEQLNHYQQTTKLYILPFDKIQDNIIITIPAEQRMLLYRRAMLQLAEKIAAKEQAQALITGENLGQEASQTIENLTAIQANTKLPIIRPLIAYNKDDIIKEAKKYGTYEISIRPYGDCCSYMIAEHPDIKATTDKINQLEKKTKIAELVEEAVQQAEMVIYK